MNRRLPQRTRCALALSAALGWGGLGLPALAQSTSDTAVSATRAFNIPAQSLGDALNLWAQQSQIAIAGPQSLLVGKTSPAVNGSLTPQQALEQLLRGSGLQAVREGPSYVVRPIPRSADIGTLDTVSVLADRPGSSDVQRGYVAKRSAVGKTDASIMETSRSVSVVTREQMEAQGVQTVEQALRYTSGVLTEVTGYDLRYASLNVRGFDAVLYRDGLRMFKTGTYGDWLTEPQGVERVEVLKGPSALLYGQGGPGGIVNQESKRPVVDPINVASISVGNHNRYQVGFDMGRPLNEDKTLLFRLNGMARDSDTQTDHSRDDRFYIAPSITWKPNARTSLTVLADATRDRMTPKSWWPNQSLLGSYAHGQIPVRAFAGEPRFDHYNRDMYSVGYLFEHQFDDGLTLRQNTRFSRYELDYQHVYATAVRPDQTSVNRASLISRSTSNVATVDTHVQKDVTTGELQHRVLLGMDLQRFSGGEDLGFGSAPVLDIFNPVYGLPFTDPVTARTDASVRQYGFYLQDQIRWGGWVFNAGLRHDRSTTHRKSGTTVADAKDSKTTGSAGAIYQFSNGLAPYVSYSTGFMPVVGTNYRSTPEPETSVQYEVGLKYQPPGSDTLLTAAVFDLRRRNVTTLDPLNTALRVQTGEVRSKGLELELKSRLMRGLDVVGSYTYLDASVTRSNDPLELGKQPFQTARNTAKLWLNYAFQDPALHGLTAGVGVRRVGRTVADTYNRYWNPDYTLVDVALGYTTGSVRYALNVANAGNKVTFANRAQFYGQARAITASMTYHW